MKIRVVLTLSLLLSSSTLASAQGDPCQSTLSLEDYFDNLTAQISDEVNGRKSGAVEAATEQAEAITANELASRASGDGLTDGRLDLLHRAFVALGLGQVSEEEGQLVFNFNPKTRFHDIGQLSPRVIVHDPVIFSPLEESFGGAPAAPLQARQKELQDSLGELDDVEARIRWTRESDTPLTLIQDMASTIFQDVYDKAASPTMAELAEQGAFLTQAVNAIGQTVATAQRVEELEKKVAEMSANQANEAATSEDEEAAASEGTDAAGGEEGNEASGIKMPVSKACENPEAKAQVLQLDKALREKGAAALTNLRDALTKAHFFQLADLIDGESRFTGEGSYRRRAEAAGPDERALSLRYEVGTVSYSDFKRWVKRNGIARQNEVTGEKEVDMVASVQKYLDETAGGESIPKFSLTAEYSESPELRIPLVDGTPDFVQPKASKVSIIGRGGWYLGGATDRNRRLEFEATYDDVTDDPARQDRLVGTVSWVEKLNADLAQIVGGSDLVVSLVWADKPEFRGDVDEDLGLRFGLKWSFGDGTTP